MEAMHKDSCACAKSELDLFSVPPTQVEMEKGFWEDIDPITSIAASDGANLDADVQVEPEQKACHTIITFLGLCQSTSSS